DQPPPDGVSRHGPGDGTRLAIWQAATRAAARIQRATAAGAAGAAGAAPRQCTHDGATTAYRPTAAIREFVEARDQTCRQPTCRQPAHHGDLDHTRPWDQGGPTCSCNLGSRCRTHHQLKQAPGWTLQQPRPGYFTLRTPAGRTYATAPDSYAA
ncbi:MAG: HNH endonuclease, partial [Streptosporangiaceae bacterium]